ncbi:S1 family peptidase [Paenibacillus ginsengarvi]|nr:serine protease [Paenibacillus ginsengarvi]
MSRTGKTTVLAVLVLLLFTGTFTVTQADPPNTYEGDSLYAAVERAVFYVRALRADGSLKDTGTGFVVRPDGTALTASHVVNEADAIECVLNDTSAVPCRVEVQDASADTAVLKLFPPSDDSGAGKPFSYIPLRTRAVKIGERIYAIGYPMKNTAIITEGIVNSPRAEINGRDRMLVSSQLASGMSGGPLLDSHGYAAGVLSGSLRTMNGIHLAVDAQQALQVLEQIQEK